MPPQVPELRLGVGMRSAVPAVGVHDDVLVGVYLVIGGELTDLEHTTFKDLDQVEIVGVFPNYASAHAAWKAKAQQTVDNAHMRYFVVHLHRLLDPGQDTKSSS